MLSRNGTIDYDVEAHTLDAQKTSTAYQESTTGNLQPVELIFSQSIYPTLYKNKIRVLCAYNENCNVQPAP